MPAHAFYKVDGDKLVRLRRSCPKCGEGVFMAEHEDRLACGRCGYTEKKGGQPAADEGGSDAPES